MPPLDRAGTLLADDAEDHPRMHPSPAPDPRGTSMARRRLLRWLTAAVPLAAAVVGAVFVGVRRASPAPPEPGGAGVGPSPADLSGAAPQRPSHDAAPVDGGTTVTPGASAAGAAAAPERATVAMIGRDALGLVPPLAGGVVQQPVRVTVHHSAVILEDARRAPTQLRAFQRDHQRRGWVDVAYHRAVDPDGNVYELRDPTIAGDSSTPYDTTGHLALLCLGDFDQQEPTEPQLEALAALIAAECAVRGIPLATLTAHRDHVLTWCPGEALYARMEEVAARSAALLEQGAPTLRRIDGPEGASRVSAIEAGDAEANGAGR